MHGARWYLWGHLAIIVPVVDGPIDVKLFVGLLKRLGHHVARIVKSAKQRRWTAIVGRTFAHAHWTVNIKLQIKYASTHVAEVVVDTAHGTCCVETVLVEHVVVEGHCLLITATECLVGELDQNHRCASTPGKVACGFAHATGLALGVSHAWCAHLPHRSAVSQLVQLVGVALIGLMR